MLQLTQKIREWREMIKLGLWRHGLEGKKREKENVNNEKTIGMF